MDKTYMKISLAAKKLFKVAKNLEKRKTQWDLQRTDTIYIFKINWLINDKLIKINGLYKKCEEVEQILQST